ncbi:hypothetical protein BKA62DRAFT_173007 [Auriculariales sp. MPI-PUGE-AT-0066]|nr:hypothetical protein BKA62DRAFT_173007 [Auriculariales sp. MPI-PUGE-AT-0066]
MLPGGMFAPAGSTILPGGVLLAPGATIPHGGFTPAVTPAPGVPMMTPGVPMTAHGVPMMMAPGGGVMVPVDAGRRRHSRSSSRSSHRSGRSQHIHVHEAPSVLPPQTMAPATFPPPTTFQAPPTAAPIIVPMPSQAPPTQFQPPPTQFQAPTAPITVNIPDTHGQTPHANPMDPRDMMNPMNMWNPMNPMNPMGGMWGSRRRHDRRGSRGSRSSDESSLERRRRDRRERRRREEEEDDERRRRRREESNERSRERQQRNREEEAARETERRRHEQEQGEARDTERRRLEREQEAARESERRRHEREEEDARDAERRRRDRERSEERRRRREDSEVRQEADRQTRRRPSDRGRRTRDSSIDTSRTRSLSPASPRHRRSTHRPRVPAEAANVPHVFSPQPGVHGAPTHGAPTVLEGGHTGTDYGMTPARGTHITEGYPPTNAPTIVPLPYQSMFPDSMHGHGGPELRHPSPHRVIHTDDVHLRNRQMEIEARERELADRQAHHDMELGGRERELANREARREIDEARRQIEVEAREREFADREARLAARERELEEAQNRIMELEHETRGTLDGARAAQTDLSYRFGTAEDGREDMFHRHEADRQRLFEESEDRRRAEAEARRQAIFNMPAVAPAATFLPATPPAPAMPMPEAIIPDIPAHQHTPPPHIASRRPTPPPELAVPPASLPVPVPAVVDLTEHRLLLTEMAEQIRIQMTEQLEEMRMYQEKAAAAALEREEAAAAAAMEREARMQELIEQAVNRQNEMERSRIESLEAELQNARDQQESDRLLREQELQQRMDRDAEAVSENFRDLRTGLGDITNLIHERDNSDAIMRETLDAHWAEKDGRRGFKEQKQDELLALVAQVIRCCDELKERADEDRASFMQRHEDVVQNIRGQTGDMNEQLKHLGDGLHDDATRRHMELLQGVQQAAQGITLPNVEEYLNKFSRSLADEVRILLGEVGNLRHERRTLQYEIGEYMIWRSKLDPGGQFDNTWAPNVPQRGFPAMQGMPPMPGGMPMPPMMPMMPPMPDSGGEEPAPARPAWRKVSEKKSKLRKAKENIPVSAPPPLPPHMAMPAMSAMSVPPETGSWTTWMPAPQHFPSPPIMSHPVPEVAVTPGLFGPRADLSRGSRRG